MLANIIELYKFTFKTIELSQNPRTHLAVINNFFNTLKDQGLNHLIPVFLKDFINPLINLFKHSNIEFASPDDLKAARYLISKSITLTDNEIIKHELKSIMYQLNIKLLLVFYYLGEAENGKRILEEIIKNNFITESNNIISEFPGKNIKYESTGNNKLIDPSVFKRSIIFDVMQKINYEIQRINSYSNDLVNILMIESETIAGQEWFFGSVMELGCEIEFNKNVTNSPIKIDNITDISENNLKSAKNNIWTASKTILKKFNTIINEYKNYIHLRFQKMTGVYKGSSYGSGAVILITASILKYLKSRYSLNIACAAAFSGGIESNGDIEKLPEKVLRYKIEAAFFSWVKFIILPSENYISAVNILNSLKNKYPRKILNIIPVKNTSDIFSHNYIAKIKKDTVSEYFKKYLIRHKLLTYTIISSVLIAITLLAAWKFIPRNVKPLPQSQSYLNLYYTPDRDASWIFENSDRVGGDTITFGEIAIGDMLTHRIALWNNDEKKQPIRLKLEGKDKDEFEILWAIDPAQKEVPSYTYNDIRQRIYLKFVPWKEPGEKNAILNVYSEDIPNKIKKIYLKGIAGNFENGYSLRMRNDDEYVINPKQGNFLQDEFTIMFWFKTNKPNIRLINDDNSNHTDTKFSLLVDYDTTIGMHILESGAMQTYSNKIVSKNKVKLNEWNSLAVSHNKNITTIYLNNEQTIYKSINSHLKQIEDYFFIGSEVHPMQRASNTYRKDEWELFISELKIYKKEMNSKDISSELIQQCSYNDDRLKLYHNFEETVGHFVQDASKNDIPGELIGLPEKSLDYPSVKRLSGIPIYDLKANNYVKIYNKGEIRLNKNIFTPKSSFTIQFEAKANGNLKKNWREFFHLSGIQYFYGFYVDSAGFIKVAREDFINDNSIELARVDFTLDSNWHKYTIDYNKELNKGRLFIDSKLKAEYDMGKSDYDITRQFFCIIFGKEGQYDNPRFWGEACSIDNISIFNRTLTQEEINNNNNPEKIKSIPGIIALWTFTKVQNNVCFDGINKYPVFIWEEYEILEGK